MPLLTTNLTPVQQAYEFDLRAGWVVHLFVLLVWGCWTALHLCDNKNFWIPGKHSHLYNKKIFQYPS
jgi:hypothetical protein